MKKKFFFCLLFFGFVFSFASCQSVSYKKHAEIYKISEDDIKQILGVYLYEFDFLELKEKDPVITWSYLLTWFEIPCSWGKAVTNSLRTPFEIDVYDENSLYFWDALDEYKVLGIIKLSDNEYKLHIRAIRTSLEAWIDLSFTDLNNIKVNYFAMEGHDLNTKEPILMRRLSGPLMEYKPLAAKYVVAREPYAKNARLYSSLEEKTKAESEIFRKLKEEYDTKE